MGKAILDHIAKAYGRVHEGGCYEYGRGWKMSNVEGVVLLYHYGTLIAADFGNFMMCTATSASDRDAVNSLCRLTYGHAALCLRGGRPNDGGMPSRHVIIQPSPLSLLYATRDKMTEHGKSVLLL